MNNKKYYIVIFILVVLLIIIIGMIGFKNLKNANESDNTINDETTQKPKTYTGNVKCEIENVNNDIYDIYFIENIEVENDIVKTNETKNKIIYKNVDTYKEFKENVEVLDPAYDDENLTVLYTFQPKEELPNEDVDEYIKNLTDIGYKCKKVIDKKELQ